MSERPHYDLIELCAGTAAVSWAALGVPGFPVSRIGSKQGYVEPILDALQFDRPPKCVLLVEADARMAADLEALADASERALAIEFLERCLKSKQSARDVWEAARDRSIGTLAGDRFGRSLVHTAGARGGIGGFKGKHKLRPSVDGFIPSLPSLIKRLKAFDVHQEKLLAYVVHDRVENVSPLAYAPTRVYIDPPYEGREGYDEVLSVDAYQLAETWSTAGHHVVLSSGVRYFGSYPITTQRRGQARKSLTKNVEEYLTVFDYRSRQALRGTL